MGGSNRNCNITGSSSNGKSLGNSNTGLIAAEPCEATSSFGSHGNRHVTVLGNQGNFGTTESSDGNHETESSTHEQSADDNE